VALPPQESIGGIYKLQDGRVWIGSIGAIWEYDFGIWRQLVLSGDELFRFFTEDDHGVVYGATDTGVYQVENGKFTSDHFTMQDQKPLVVSEDGKFSDCSFDKDYFTIANCSGMWGEKSPEHHFKAVFLQVGEDGSVTYINNHIVAKLQDQVWKSFLFNSFTIASAAVDVEGHIWIFSDTDGLVRLESDIFSAYQGLVLP